MFRDSLLENSLTTRKRWPVLAAFTLEILAGAAIVAIPLLSGGVIPVAAHAPLVAPILPMNVERLPEHPSTSGDTTSTFGPSRNLVTITNTSARLRFGKPGTEDPNVEVSPNLQPTGATGSSSVGPDLCSRCSSAPTLSKTRLKVSNISPGQLIHRVEPTYPRIANAIHLQGEVKLHAIIARDGSIEDLSVTSGHPLLAAAAMDAVKQWRYRPFLLNGQPVEVETTITVNFRRSGD